MLLRESKLNDADWDTVENWTGGPYDFDQVSDKLRKLERPSPSGKGGHRIHGMSSSNVMRYQCDEEMRERGEPDHGDTHWIFMQHSLFTLPEVYDEDEIWKEAIRYVGDKEVLFVAGDLPEELVLEEDEAVAIYASHSQVRQHLHKKEVRARLLQAASAERQDQRLSKGTAPREAEWSC